MTRDEYDASGRKDSYGQDSLESLVHFHFSFRGVFFSIDRCSSVRETLQLSIRKMQEVLRRILLPRAEVVTRLQLYGCMRTRTT